MSPIGCREVCTSIETRSNEQRNQRDDVQVDHRQGRIISLVRDPATKTVKRQCRTAAGGSTKGSEKAAEGRQGREKAAGSLGAGSVAPKGSADQPRRQLSMRFFIMQAYLKR